MAQWRLFLISGMLSILMGILYVTSLLEGKSNGLNTWGYLLLFWGIAVMMLSLKRINISVLIKSIAGIGILLHGSATLFWILFPIGSETFTKGNTILFYVLPGVLITVFCMYTLGIKMENNNDKMK